MTGRPQRSAPKSTIVALTHLLTVSSTAAGLSYPPSSHQRHAMAYTLHILTRNTYFGSRSPSLLKSGCALPRYSQHNDSKFKCLFASRTSICTLRSNCSLVSRNGSPGGADRFKRYLKSAQAVSWRRKSARSLGWLLPSAPPTYNRKPFVSTDGKLERRLGGGEMGVG